MGVKLAGEQRCFLCRDRARTRGSASLKMRASLEGGKVQIARFVDAFCNFFTEADGGPLRATEMRCGYASGTCQRLQRLERVTSTLFSVALRGPRASSVLKIPGLTSARQSNGETPGSDTTTASNVPCPSHRHGIAGPIGGGNGGQRRPPKPIAINHSATRSVATLSVWHCKSWMVGLIRGSRPGTTMTRTAGPCPCQLF
jgi:hypothetical protein